MKNFNYDVIIVGGGHAGLEACTVSSRLGLKTLLITSDKNKISYMSCNPSIGGLGKGHMVKELDALGGLMGIAADHSCIQFKRLNSSKGPAVRGSRAQCEKNIYSFFMSQLVLNYPNLEVLESEVSGLILKSNTCHGVTLIDQSKIFSKTVVICTGTFMKGVMHIGDKRIEGGRVGEKATIGISDQLKDFNFQVFRLKTGTPPRLKKNSINWEKTEPQSGDTEFVPFSFRSKKDLNLPQIQCYLTYTNENTHNIIRENLDKSPMYTGAIQGIGPRYCPSIEDKITRFSDKERHQTFLEPEGLNTEFIYLQGISTSLPEEIQIKFLKTIPGLENVELFYPGYAVEYDFFNPQHLKHSLETKIISNLFFAGQINGTSGYEEAAVQGFVAGVNAANKVLNREPFIMRRDQSYIGVLIDDLINKGTKEPYRMMTSRAEHRLNLREDNTLERLASIGHQIGSLDDKTFLKIQDLLIKREKLLKVLEETKIVPNEKNQSLLRKMGTKVILKPLSLKELLRRNELNCYDLRIFGVPEDLSKTITEPVEILVKYEGYIQRELEMIKKSSKLEELLIPDNILYKKIAGLSCEEVEKLDRIKPRSIGQAQRISGVNPSAIKALVIHLKAHANI
ncbi:MAG: tRNA uridine-5-carboxymethylaminomethyl(34) synthesis enzyme MnmG [Bdellovibrionaceae bacterium]|nr:tRNA uridine-5-carboxymethylaminomethyl(34) synthesis enzyme MnmG [Pseudobdellovibrionaceae bacterium]